LLYLDPAEGARVGVTQAIFLNKLRHWTGWKRERNQVDANGEVWVYNTFAGWKQQIPWLSESKFREMTRELREAGLIETKQANSPNRRNHYRLTEKGAEP